MITVMKSRRPGTSFHQRSSVVLTIYVYFLFHEPFTGNAPGLIAGKHYSNELYFFIAFTFSLRTLRLVFCIFSRLNQDFGKF